MLTHNGRIAIYEKDPKSWRTKGRKRKPSAQAIPTIIESVRSPAEIAREKRRRRLREFWMSFITS